MKIVDNIEKESDESAKKSNKKRNLKQKIEEVVVVCEESQQCLQEINKEKQNGSIRRRQTSQTRS